MAQAWNSNRYNVVNNVIKHCHSDGNSKTLLTCLHCLQSVSSWFLNFVSAVLQQSELPAIKLNYTIFESTKHKTKLNACFIKKKVTNISAVSNLAYKGNKRPSLCLKAANLRFHLESRQIDINLGAEHWFVKSLWIFVSLSCWFYSFFFVTFDYAVRLNVCFTISKWNPT